MSLYFEHYDADERRLVDSARDELWSVPLVDEAVDAALDLLTRMGWAEVPPGSGRGWERRSTALLALSSLSLRAMRVVALAVRAGYAPEAFASVRRLQEAAGHAVSVARDETGQYASNWLAGRGKAASPRAAFGTSPEENEVWRLMSNLSHASFAEFTRLASEVDGDQRLVHRVGPHRSPGFDNVVLWLSGRQLVRTLAAVHIVRPDLDQQRVLAAGTAIDASTDRVARDIEEWRRVLGNRWGQGP
jgi:hypothetical protein